VPRALDWATQARQASPPPTAPIQYDFTTDTESSAWGPPPPPPPPLPRSFQAVSAASTPPPASPLRGRSDRKRMAMQALASPTASRVVNNPTAAAAAYVPSATLPPPSYYWEEPAPAQDAEQVNPPIAPLSPVGRLRKSWSLHHVSRGRSAVARSAQRAQLALRHPVHLASY
jgi:hypothetical protein